MAQLVLSVQIADLEEFKAVSAAMFDWVSEVSDRQDITPAERNLIQAITEFFGADDDDDFDLRDDDVAGPCDQVKQ